MVHPPKEYEICQSHISPGAPTASGPDVFVACDGTTWIRDNTPPNVTRAYAVYGRLVGNKIIVDGYNSTRGW